MLAEDDYYDKFHADLLELINKYPSVELKHLGFIEKWKSILNDCEISKKNNY